MLKIYCKILYLIDTILNLSIVVILNVKNIFNKSYYPKKKSDLIQILGNGPSLKNDISEIISKRKESAMMVVNSFAINDLYETLKPDYYIIVDPSFFRKSSLERIKNLQINTINALSRKTNWELYLFLPISAKKSIFYKTLKSENYLIKFVFFKNIPVINGDQKLKDFLFKYKLANPLYMNVLIAAIFQSIKMDFSKIYLWGADHSWHEDFILGKDNYLYTLDRHFFNVDEKCFVHCKSDGTPVKVYEEFFTLSNTFKIYHSIESFSKKMGIKIINLSSKTWIDAFERIEK
jgi:hypothetical protein